MPGVRATVLIVDDDEAAVLELRDLVAASGWGVESAAGAAEAFDLLAQRPDIGVVLTDLYMSGSSGFDLIARTREALPSPPAFVVVTAYPAYDVAVRAIQNDVVDFVEKPISGRALREALVRAAASGRGAARVDASAGAARDVPGKSVADFIRLRDHVRRTLSESLSSDPCLDILLHAADAEFKGDILSVSTACSVAGVPRTTALRRIAELEEAGLLERRSSPTDKRLSILSLTDAGRHRVSELARRFGARSSPPTVFPVAGPGDRHQPS